MEILKILNAGGPLTAIAFCACVFAMGTWYHAYQWARFQAARKAVLFSLAPIATSIAGIAVCLWDWQQHDPNAPFDREALIGFIVIAIYGLIFTAIPMALSLVLLRRLRNAPAIAV